MRSRSISIYSQEDFEKQILSYKKENSNVQIIRPQSNSVVSYSEEINKEVDETNSEEDLIKMLTSLNKSYKINNNLNQSELNPTTLSIITKCLKDIIQSKNSLLFNRDKRIKSSKSPIVHQSIPMSHSWDFIRYFTPVVRYATKELFILSVYFQ